MKTKKRAAARFLLSMHLFPTGTQSEALRILAVHKITFKKVNQFKSPHR
jgi:hypothetical protein